MGTLWHEIGHALRRLGKNPTTTFTAVITLALGIGDRCQDRDRDRCH
jgi:hypothetical protein